MDIYFCDECASRINDADLRRGHGIKKSDIVICGGCIDKGRGGDLLSRAGRVSAAPKLMGEGVLDRPRDRVNTLEETDERVEPPAASETADVAPLDVDHRGLGHLAGGFGALGSGRGTGSIEDDDKGAEAAPEAPGPETPESGSPKREGPHQEAPAPEALPPETPAPEAPAPADEQPVGKAPEAEPAPPPPAPEEAAPIEAADQDPFAVSEDAPTPGAPETSEVHLRDELADEADNRELLAGGATPEEGPGDDLPTDREEEPESVGLDEFASGEATLPGPEAPKPEDVEIADADDAGVQGEEDAAEEALAAAADQPQDETGQYEASDAEAMSTDSAYPLQDLEPGIEQPATAGTGKEQSIGRTSGKRRRPGTTRRAARTTGRRVAADDGPNKGLIVGTAIGISALLVIGLLVIFLNRGPDLDSGPDIQAEVSGVVTLTHKQVVDLMKRHDAGDEITVEELDAGLEQIKAMNLKIQEFVKYVEGQEDPWTEGQIENYLRNLKYYRTKNYGRNLRDIKSQKTAP